MDDHTPEQTAPAVPEPIAKHADAMQAKVDGHLARSEQRLDAAVVATGDVIGKVGAFAKNHTPDSIGRHIENITDRAKTALTKKD